MVNESSRPNPTRNPATIPPVGTNTPEERIFDEFFDAMLRGEIRSPEYFLASRGDVPESLREHLHGIHRMLTEDKAEPAVSAPPLAAEDGMPWEQLGEFRLVRKLGEGGMGVVFLAEQESLGRLVALKILRPDLSASSNAAIRFEREAHAIARMNHPHIVKVIAFGEDQGVNFLAMELAPGKDLDELLQELADRGETIDIPRVLRWCADLADALHSAHEQGVIHRDVKPSNVRITPDDRAMLLDFGVARELESNQATLTRSFLGSPAYMAPEQIAAKGGKVDARTDVYALGITMYQCLTGALPFRRETLEEVFHDVLVEPPAAPRKARPELSNDVETVILKAIDKEPEQRFVDAAAFARDLRALLMFLPIEARPPGPLKRLARAARRHSAITTLLLATPLALIAFFAVQQIERKVERTTTIEEAHAKIVQYRNGIEEARELGARVTELQMRAMSEYLAPERDLELDAFEDQVLAERRSREESFYAILDLIRRAADLDAAPEAITELRGRLYMAKYMEVIAAGDPLLRTVYHNLVQRNDPKGTIMGEEVNPVMIEIECNVEGAKLYRFRSAHAREELGQTERRWVPAPHGTSPTPVKPGTFCLVLLEDAQGLYAGDLVVKVAGHAIREAMLVSQGSGQVQLHDRLISIGGHPVLGHYEVDMYGRRDSYLPRLGSPTAQDFVFERNGQQFTERAADLTELGIEVATPREVVQAGAVVTTLFSQGELHSKFLESGLRVDETATPLIYSKASLVGITPLGPFDVGNESRQVLVLRAPGYEPQLVPIDQRGRRIDLLPQGTSPAKFVRIVDRTMSTPLESAYFWMRRHEVTFGEYLEFLNDPETQREVGESETPIRRPRGGPGQSKDLCRRNPDGSFQLRPNWPAEVPVFGVSWYDAQAYAKWKTAKAKAAGLPHVYSLPKEHEWMSSAGPHQKFLYGDRFHPKWTSSCFSKPLPYPQRVMSYPIDRSLSGVFDVCGNVSEWLDAWWVEEQDRRWHVGGAWSDGGPASMFQVSGGNGSRPEEVFDQIGFRLVMHMDS